MRKIREKVTGKLLTLDKALEPTLPAFLALLDMTVEDEQWQSLDPPQRRQRTLDAVKRLLLRESHIQPLRAHFRGPPLDRFRAQAVLDSLIESLPTARVLLCKLPSGVPARMGKQNILQPAANRSLPPESAGELLQTLLGNDTNLLPSSHC